MTEPGSSGAAVPTEPPVARSGPSDHRVILSGTLQNLLGLAVFAIATFGIQILVGQRFGPGVFGVVTIGTQLGFIAAAATRFGMDMASTRMVAIEAGKGMPGRARSIVRLGSMIAGGISIAVAGLLFILAPALADWWNTPTSVVVAGAVSIPFVALTFVFTSASRGLKIMKHTLAAYWIGQSVSWIVFALVVWQFSPTAGATVYAYAASWVFAAGLSGLLWWRASRGFPAVAPEPGEVQALVRYGAPRAPAALLSQAVFWIDFFVLSGAAYVTVDQRGVYAASVKLSQTLFLFLTAVSYMFSPFVADLYERGEKDKLNGLFKTVTRWTFALTLPLLGLLFVLPGPALRIFGAGFTSDTTALRILLVGQIVNVSVGAAGFVLIMVKRTGWDLVVYASSFVLDVVLCVVLINVLQRGPAGAATAQTITIIFSNGLRIFLVWKFVGIHPYNKYYFRLAVPFAACVATMVVVHGALGTSVWAMDLLITGITGTVVYGLIVLAVCLTPTERTQISAGLAKVRSRSSRS